MGVSMITMVLTLPLGREPDWEAAAQAIRAVPLENLWDTGDDLFPWEIWLAEVENLPGAAPACVALRAAQFQLHTDAVLLRGALEYGWPDELIEFRTPTHLA